MARSASDCRRIPDLSLHEDYPVGRLIRRGEQGRRMEWIGLERLIHSIAKTLSIMRGYSVNHPVQSSDTSFNGKAALLWQNILNVDPREVFSGVETHAVSREGSNDDLPQPGYVGPNYEPGNILLLGQNPGNDPIGKGISASDALQYRHLRKLKDCGPEHAQKTYIELMETLGENVMPKWPLIRNVVIPFLSEIDMKLSDVAFTNIAKFRTTSSSFQTIIYERSWLLTLEQIELLQPGNIVCLGEKTRSEFCRRYKGSIPVHRIRRAIGDTRLPPTGRHDIQDIIQLL